MGETLRNFPIASENYTLSTSIQDGLIEQRLDYHMFDKSKEITRWICNTRENEIRKALIKLGWTPPTEGETV